MSPVGAEAVAAALACQMLTTLLARIVASEVVAAEVVVAEVVVAAAAANTSVFGSETNAEVFPVKNGSALRTCRTKKAEKKLIAL